MGCHGTGAPFTLLRGVHQPLEWKRAVTTINMPPYSDRPRRITIIGKSNGVGLTRDIELLTNCLLDGGHEVAVHTPDTIEARRRRSLLSQASVRFRLARPRSKARAAQHTDVNIMLEHLWSQFLPSAHRNVVVPNPEWFDRHDVRFLSRVDSVWAKTRHAAQIFRDLGRSTRVISFDSKDHYRPEVQRERRFFHLAGKSRMKGTDRLLRAWARRPHWPTLTVIQHHADSHAPEVRAPNIDRRCGYVEESQLLREQNACMFHVCPSLTEGWGHYIVEAMSVGAVTLTLDAPPMNELITSDRGLLFAYERTGKQRLTTTYFFCESSLEAAVERAIAMNTDEWSRLSASARRWFHANRADFQHQVHTALQELLE